MEGSYYLYITEMNVDGCIQEVDHNIISYHMNTAINEVKLYISCLRSGG